MPASDISLEMLINDGLLSPGELLKCEPRKGEIYRGTLNADGTISYEDQIFEHPSRWSKHVSGSTATNGWKVIYAKGESIDDLRERYTGGSSSSGVVAAMPTPKSEASASPYHVASGTSIAETPDTQVRPQAEIDEMLRQHILNLTPDEFRELVREYLNVKGFSNAELEIVISVKV